MARPPNFANIKNTLEEAILRRKGKQKIYRVMVNGSTKFVCALTKGDAIRLVAYSVIDFIWEVQDVEIREFLAKSTKI